MGRIILKVPNFFLFSLLRNNFKPTKLSLYQTLVQGLLFYPNLTLWLLMIQIVSFTKNYITIQHISNISNLQLNCHIRKIVMKMALVSELSK